MLNENDIAINAERRLESMVTDFLVAIEIDHIEPDFRRSYAVAQEKKRFTRLCFPEGLIYQAAVEANQRFLNSESE